MKKEGRFWIILAILLLTVAIINFVAGLRMSLIVIPLILSIIFVLNYAQIKIGGKFYIKEQQHQKQFLIIFIILLLIVTTIMFVKGMGMNVIIVPLAGTIIGIFYYVRRFVLKKQNKK